MKVFGSYLFALIDYVPSRLQQSENIEDSGKTDMVIFEPDPISFTFDTLGWKIVGVLCLILIIYGAYKWYLHYQKNAYKRNAIAVLNALNNNIGSKNNVAIVEKISVELKKVAIISFGRNQVAPLSGTSWLSFLQEKGKHTPFLQFDDEVHNVIYNRKEIDSKKLTEMLQISIKWIKTHA